MTKIEKYAAITIGWTACTIWSAGAFRAMERHEFPSSEADPVVARAHAATGLLFSMGGPFAIPAMLIFTGAGAYGWENPLGACYWQAHAYNEPCGRE